MNGSALPQTAIHPQPAVPTPGREQVLVLEDEALVRVFLGRALRSLGHVVFEASDSQEGLELYQREAIGLVLMDWSMPGLSGADLLATLRARKPQVPVVVCSGYPLGPDQLAGCAGFLAKPVLVDELFQLVQQVLNQGAGPAL